ncbi:MAG: NADH-quinone oxidoreductase subunit J [Candidatus Bathyarchaeia archaeon]
MSEILDLSAISQLVLIILTVVSAFIAVEIRNILKAIAAFFFMSVLLAVIFFILGAPFAAAVQLLVYAGAVVVLLLVTFRTVRRL